MSFTAKVKATGQLFQATTVFGTDGTLGRDAYELHNGESYAGHLFVGPQVSESAELAEFEFTKADWATFKAEELENIDVKHIKLYPLHAREPVQ